MAALSGYRVRGETVVFVVRCRITAEFSHIWWQRSDSFKLEDHPEPRRITADDSFLNIFVFRIMTVFYCCTWCQYLTHFVLCHCVLFCTGL